jgi:oligoendopeptidase F
MLKSANMTNIKTTWNFSKLYKDIDDKKIELDIKNIDKLFKAFAKKYEDRKFIKSSKSLLEALNDYNILSKNTSSKPLWYLGLQQALNSSNNDIQAKLTKLSNDYLKSYKHILFFTLVISKVETKTQVKYLNDKALKKYHYYLKVLFDQGKHTLSENEEKILTDKAQVAHTAWEEMNDRYINQQTVKFKNKDMSLSEAMSIKADLPRKDRRVLHKAVMEKYKEISFVAEGELNAVIQNKRIDDELRGFTKPYEATIMGYENDLKSIEGLVDIVTKNNHISHDFFKLKARVLNKKEKSDDKNITMADLGTSVSTAKTGGKKIDFKDACKMVSESFLEIDKEFSDIFESYLASGQIDVYPKLGKRTGAFCSPNTEVPTYVMLNYADKLSDVSTLAHEMGHAIHSDLAKTQGTIYEGYTISVAEVASTFFENVLFDNLLKVASPEEKKDLLINKVQHNIFTIFAQIAYFQYEKNIHKAIREKGFVSREELASMFADCRRSYVGDALQVVPDDGYAYVYISHFRSFFYVYTYAYGQIIANALYEEYKKDKKFSEKIKIFLKTGGSMSPEDTFKTIGIDTSRPDFFKKGLEKIEKDLREVEAMF